MKTTKAMKTVQSLVPSFYALAIASTGISIMGREMQKMFGLEIKQRMLEFKRMGVIEIQVIDKNKGTKTEYHYLNGIKEYLINFCKKNKKWKWEYENYAGLETGRIILTRVYRTYNKRQSEEDVCPECGRSYDYD